VPIVYQQRELADIYPLSPLKRYKFLLLAVSASELLFLYGLFRVAFATAMACS